MLDRLVSMDNDNDRSTRESSIASGWMVEGPPEAVPQEAQMVDESGDFRIENGTPQNLQLSSGTLVLFGLIGGLYLVFTFVWFSWANAAAQVAASTTEASVWSALQQMIFWIAPFAPALWFVTVLVLSRGAHVRWILLWTLLGAVLLMPLPMFGGLFS